MNKLPKSFIDRGLKLAKESLLFGQPIESLTRDELVAAAALGFHSYHKLLLEGRKSVPFRTSEA